MKAKSTQISKMAAKKKQLYSQSTLEQLSTQPNSCVSLVESERKLELHPIYLNDIKSGVWDLLNKNLKRFDRSLNGILMGYKNVRIVVDHDTGRIKGRCGEFEVLVKLQFYIFQPRVGSYLEGIVNKKSKNHIGCLVHRYFNAVILKPELIEYEDWICKDFDIDDKVVFKVNELDFSGMLPRIEGVVEKDCFNKKDCTRKKKKHVKDEKSNESQSDEGLDESFLQIEMASKDTQEEKKEEKMSKKDKKQMKKNLESVCNSTQRLSITGKEIQDADFSFLSPVAPPMPIKKKKKDKQRDSDESDNFFTSTQLPTAIKVDDTSDLSMLSPIVSVDEGLKIKKKKKKKDKEKEKDKEKKNADEVDMPPITSTHIPLNNNEKLDTDDFYIFTPVEKDEESSKDKDQIKKKEKTKKKLGDNSIATTNAQIPVQNQGPNANDSFTSDQGADKLLKDKKQKKKKKDKHKEKGRSEEKKDQSKLTSETKNKPTESKQLETNSVQKENFDKKNVDAEKSFDPLEAWLATQNAKKPSKKVETKEVGEALDPLEALELGMKLFKKPCDKSDSDDDIFIPPTQNPPNTKLVNLPEILSKSSYSKTTDSDVSQKSLQKDSSKFNSVNVKSPLKLTSPRKRILSDSDSESSSLAKKPKFNENAKDAFKNKLKAVNHKSLKKKIEPEKIDSPTKKMKIDSEKLESPKKIDSEKINSPKKVFSPEKSLFSDSDSSVKKSPKKLKKIESEKMDSPKKLCSPEKSLFSDSDASVKKSPKKLPKTQNLLIDDLLKEQTLTMLGRDEKKEESSVPVKKTKKDESSKSKKEGKKEKAESKKNKSEMKIEISNTNKLMDDLLAETKKFMNTEETPKKDQSKSSKKNVVNGTIDERLPDLVRDSSERILLENVSKKKKKKRDKKEKDVGKVDEVSSVSLHFNSTTKLTDLKSKSTEGSSKEKTKKSSKKDTKAEKVDKASSISLNINSTTKPTDLESTSTEGSIFKDKKNKKSKKENVKKLEKNNPINSTAKSISMEKSIQEKSTKKEDIKKSSKTTTAGLSRFDNSMIKELELDSEIDKLMSMALKNIGCKGSSSKKRKK